MFNLDLAPRSIESSSSLANPGPDQTLGESDLPHVPVVGTASGSPAGPHPNSGHHALHSPRPSRELLWGYQS